MKKLLAIALLTVFTLTVPLFAQEIANVDVQNSAGFSHGQGVVAQDHFGFYNEVTFTYRHCDKYASDVTTGHLFWKKTKHVVDYDACNADPSTVFEVRKHHNLTTNAGKDFIKAQVSGTAVTGNCVYIAVGNSAITPAAGDTTLTGEVTTNGLGRASGTYASTGTGTFTLSKQFTDVTAATSNVQSAAVFTAVSSGTMCFEVGSLGPVTLNVNDTLTVTWSGTIS